MPMSMAWYLSYRTTYKGLLSLVFLYIRWITLKSKHDSYIQDFILIENFRILMMCIKYLALCPCPQCLILKSKIPLLGSKSDMRMRYRLLRTDNEDRRRKVELARQLIFKGVNATSQRIEQILGSESLVPTLVGYLQPL